MKNKKIISAFVLMTILSSTLVGCGNNSNDNQNQTPEINTEISTETTTDNNENNENTENNQSISEIEKSDLVFDDDIKAKMVEINNAGYKYYNDTFKTSRYIPFYSYLYDMNTQKIVSMDTLKEAGYYDYDEKLKNVAFHLLLPADVIDSGLEVKTASFACTYTALPTSEGVFISSSEDEGGMISYEAYRDLLLKYVPVHGNIITPERGSDDYNGIVSAVKNSFEEPIDFTVKYISCDEKYGVITIGNKANFADIREIAVIKTDGQWSILRNELEKTTDTITTIAMNYPDFATDILPFYSIRQFGEIKTDYPNYEKSFVEQGLVEQDDTLTYSCGALGFSYFEYQSGTKIVCGLDSKNQLNCFKVNSPEQAIQTIMKKAQNPPIFIVNTDY